MAKTSDGQVRVRPGRDRGMPGGGSSRREGGQGWMVLTAWVFAMSLFWRVFAANAAILTAGALVLAFAPGPLRKYRALIDLGGLLIGQAA